MKIICEYAWSHADVCLSGSVCLIKHLTLSIPSSDLLSALFQDCYTSVHIIIWDGIRGDMGNEFGCSLLSHVICCLAARIIHSSPGPVDITQPSVMNEFDLGKQKGQNTIILDFSFSFLFSVPYIGKSIGSPLLLFECAVF